MALLNPTPPSLLTDQRGRPYFAWDLDLTLEEFLGRLEAPDPEIRAYFLAKMMRQARPDDVLQFASPQRIADEWQRVRRYLGASRPFWEWLLRTWEAKGVVHR